MYKIFRAKKINGVIIGKVYVGKASTFAKCAKIASEAIDTHNSGVVMRDPERRYIHVRGDIAEQIASGKVRTYAYDCDYPAWVGKRYKDNTVTCEIGVEYAYHRHGITTDIHFENNLDVINICDGEIVFWWDEV